MVSIGNIGKSLSTLPQVRLPTGIFGKRNDGIAERARLAKLGYRALPQYPGSNVVPVVVVPPPPLLADGMDEFSRVRHLAAGYRGSLMAVYRKQSYFMLSREVAYQPLSKHYGRLSDAACMLFVNKVAPAAWCLFSLTTWRAMEHTKRPPTVKWVFSCERIEAQREWYESERTRWARRIERPVREHVELVAAWRRLWFDLLRKRPPDRPRLLAILDDHFPGDAYERMVERATRAAQSAQNHIDQRIAKGEIPWTA